MPFLPESIRGEDYDVTKDESFNLFGYATGIPEQKPWDNPDTPKPRGLIKPIIITEKDLGYEDESSTLDDQSLADQPLTYTELKKDNVYVGDIPLDVIMEGIENQFNDYINIEDRTNYVDIFYNQLHKSYALLNDGTETFQDDLKDILDNIHQKFVDKLVELFNVRLTLSIVEIEDESPDMDEVEYIIRHLYEFFILGARNNFKVVITNDIRPKIGKIENPREYHKTLRQLLTNYSPLITSFGPMEFLRYKKDQEIIQFFEDGKVTGNFLRKYSPKLYQNEEFEVDLINYITMVQQIKEEVFNNG